MADVGPIAFVFRPGGIQRDNVFTDWAALMSALRPIPVANRIEGRKIIEFDDSLTSGGCVIPKSPADPTNPSQTIPYDMTDVVWAGFGPRPDATRSLVVIQEGARFNNLRMIGGQITVDNQANTVSPISDFVDGSNHIQIGMRDDCGNTQIFNSGDAPLFDLGTGTIEANGNSTRRVFFFAQNTLLGIRLRTVDQTQEPKPLIRHSNVDCFINFIGQNQTGNNLLTRGAKAKFGALSSSTQIGVDNISIDGNEFAPVTRIQRKVQPQPPRPPARSHVQRDNFNPPDGELGEIGLPNVLLRCDGGKNFVSLLLLLFGKPYFLLTLPHIKEGFDFALQDPTPLYTGGQEIAVAEVVGGYNLQVIASAGNTIDGSSGSVLISPRGSRIFASDGESNWITIASHRR